MPSFPLEEAAPRPAAAPPTAAPFQPGAPAPYAAAPAPHAGGPAPYPGAPAPYAAAPGPFAPGAPHLYPPQGAPAQGPDSSGVATQAALRRKSPVIFIVALVLLSVPAFFLPIVLLSAGGRGVISPSQIWMHFREGGWGMWGILASLSVTLLSLLLLGAFRIRGSRVPGALLFAPPILPFTVGSLAAISTERRLVDILGSAGIDPEQRVRIFAEGLSELSNLFVFGGLASATAMYIAATAATLSILSVDTARVATGPKSIVWLASVGAAFVAVVVSVGARFGLHAGFTGIEVFVVLGLVSAGVLATLGGRTVRLLAENRAEDEASRAFRLLAVAAFAMAACLMFLDRASVSATTRYALGALSGESVDPSQRAAILAGDVVAVRHNASITMFIDALGCLIVFAVPIAAGARVMRRFSYSALGGAAAGALAFLLGFAANARIDSDMAAQNAGVEKVQQDISAAGITLPTVGTTDNAASITDARWLLIKRDGALSEIAPTPRTPSPEMEEDPVQDPGAPVSANVAADASLTTAALVAALGPAIKGAPQAPVLLTTSPQGQSRLHELGPYAGLVGSTLAAYSVRVVPKLGEWIKPAREDERLKYQRTLGILPSASSVKLVVWSGDAPGEVQKSLSETLPLGDGFQDTERRRELLGSLRTKYGVGALLLAPSPDEKLDKVVGWLAALAASQSSRRESMPVVLTTDRAALEQAPTGGRPKIRLFLGQVLVIGRLAKDPVVAALKEALPSLEKCAAGHVEDVRLPVFMTLRFSVDKAGKPSRLAVKQSPGKDFNDCLGSTFGSLALPPAEKGLASVTASLEMR